VVVTLDGAGHQVPTTAGFNFRTSPYETIGAMPGLIPATIGLNTPIGASSTVARGSRQEL
jgi:hypothetical protein